MKRYAMSTPEGTRDLLFEECLARREVERGLTRLFKSRGFHKVITPTMEFYDVFNRECAACSPESMYSMIDMQGRMLVLRADSTFPIARIAATRLRDARYPLRLYYNQNVFRRNPRYAGLADETSQGGVELIGAKGLKADSEILLLAIDALSDCGAPDFRIELGHAGFFSGLLADLAADTATQEQICDLIEAKNYGALNDLLDALGNTQSTQAIRSLPRLFGGEEVLEKARALTESAQACEALEYLRTIYNLLKEAGLTEKVTLDLGLVHRSNYYTGILFRGFIEGSGVTALSGGRYDSLLAEFGCDLPAIGFGVEVDALAQAMLARGDDVSPKPADVLVYAEPAAQLRALGRIRTLNAEGLRCENSLAQSVQEAKEYAAAKGIPQIEIVE